VYLIGALSFIILGTSETQKFALTNETKIVFVDEELLPMSNASKETRS
jgi:hypothetical protein